MCFLFSQWLWVVIIFLVDIDSPIQFLCWLEAISFHLVWDSRLNCMYWVVLQSHVVENLPFFCIFWCFFLNIIFYQNFICFLLVHKLVQAAGLYLAKSQRNMYFVQLIMFKRRIPCLDSYLDKVSSESILSSLCEAFLCSISIILNDSTIYGQWTG